MNIIIIWLAQNLEDKFVVIGKYENVSDRCIWGHV